jgi:hypothetical protein
MAKFISGRHYLTFAEGMLPSTISITHGPVWVVLSLIVCLTLLLSAPHVHKLSYKHAPATKHLTAQCRLEGAGPESRLAPQFNSTSARLLLDLLRNGSAPQTQPSLQKIPKILHHSECRENTARRLPDTAILLLCSGSMPSFMQLEGFDIVLQV